MKTILKLIVAVVAISPFLPAMGKEEPLRVEGFEEGMRQAFVDYKKGDSEAVTAKLRELIKLMEDKDAAKVADLLPDMVNGWKGETLNREEAPGGGISLSRIYVSGEHRITVKVIKDSPVVNQLLPLLMNDELIRLSNRKTSKISGEMAIMEGENKLQMVLDGRIYLELEGDETTGETPLTGFARKLNIAALKKMK